jgi:hypothetical protein
VEIERLQKTAHKAIKGIWPWGIRLLTEP